MFIKVAAVQIDCNPALFSGSTNLLKEPIITFNEKQSNGIAFLYVTDMRLSEEIDKFINVDCENTKCIKTSYIELLRKKLYRIIKFCAEKRVDFIIFPEYSIPAECLVDIKKLSVKYRINIIAGSHIVIPENLSIYQDIFLKQIDKNSLEKNICPIIHLNGEIEHIEKINPSKLDLNIKKGEIWRIIKFSLGSTNCTEMSEISLKAPIFLCIDFTNKHRYTILNRFVKDQKEDYSFIIVPAFTLEKEDFEDDAKFCLKREKKPVIFVNTSPKGGTRIFCHFDPVTKNQLYPILYDNDNLGTVCIPDGEEGIIIVDFDPDKQFTEKPTSIPHYEVSSLKGYYPFVYSHTLNDFEKIIKKINSQENYEKKKDILRNYKVQVRDWCNYSKMYSKKIPILYKELTNISNMNLNFCLDHIYLESDIDMMDQWRLNKVENTMDFLYTILRDRRLTEEESDKIYNTIKYYRKLELKLKENKQIEIRDNSYLYIK
ncbi:MAG: hypothetical protein ACMUIU_00410 [bacterium]